MIYPPRILAVAALSIFSFTATMASAQHITDGILGPNEWNGPNASKTFFPQVGPTGGAYLYAEQTQTKLTVAGQDNLYLAYDYVNSPNLGPLSFFDVFFEVNNPKDPADYLVRIFTSNPQNFAAFERSHGSPAPIGSDGSFDIGPTSGWSPLDSADLSLARFQTAVGFGPTVNAPTPHFLAEFQLSIDRDGNGQNGLYSPDPAFWSASAKSAADPPVSSAIFTLNPDGSILVLPVLGANGGPVQRPQDVVPEPGMAATLLGIVSLTLVAAFRRKPTV